MNQTEYKMLLLNKEFVTHNPNITADFILTNLLKFWAIPHCWLSMKQLSLGKYSRKSKINTTEQYHFNHPAASVRWERIVGKAGNNPTGYSDFFQWFVRVRGVAEPLSLAQANSPDRFQKIFYQIKP